MGWHACVSSAQPMQLRGLLGSCCLQSEPEVPFALPFPLQASRLPQWWTRCWIRPFGGYIALRPVKSCTLFVLEGPRLVCKPCQYMWPYLCMS